MHSYVDKILFLKNVGVTPGMTPPLLARERSAYLKITKLWSESHHTRLRGFPGVKRWLWLPGSKGAMPLEAPPGRA
jgi:hypothetical protein